MKRSLHLGILLVLVTPLLVAAEDATPGEVRKVEVFPSAAEVRIEITLSAPAVPSVEMAQHPDRLVVNLPGTTSAAQQKRIPVQQFGVLAVRFGLNRSNPPETHLVVDLDEERPYRISTDGVKITLFVQPSLRAEARKRNAPAAAASKPLINSLGRGSQPEDDSLRSQNRSEGTLLTPPPSGPPIELPAARGSDDAGMSTTASSPQAQPSARHPNVASLQQGTVFPGAGTPGTGEVPAVSGAPQPPYDSAQRAANEATPSQVQPENPDSVSGATKETVASAASKEAVAPPAAPASVPSLDAALADTRAVARVQPLHETPQPVSEEPRPASPGPSASSSVTVSAVQGPAEPQPVSQQPKPAIAQSPEVASPVQQVPESSLPPTSGQADAVAADQTAPDNTATEQNAPQQAEVEVTGRGRAQVGQRDGENPDLRTAFRVKYVASDTAYLDGGRSVGLAEGMKLVVRDLPNQGGVAAEGADSNAAGDVAELEVLSVAENSSVTEIHEPKRPVKVGDLAYLSSADQQALVEKNVLSATRKYPAVVSFTENDTLDEEARAELPKPPSPAVNRARGRIGFNYIGVLDHGIANLYSSQVGLVVRTDITRIAGTYWNASGYWNGRFQHSNAGPQTLQDLLNRTYTLYTNYDNPNSAWVAGFGRLYLPWATSLDTIDGGYAGRKLKQGVTAGIFYGSTPDPTSFGYAPGRQIGGAFINFDGGDYNELRYTSTSGVGLQMVSWNIDRPFVFFENGIYYKRRFSIYQASQIDSHIAMNYACPSSILPIPQCTGQTLTNGTYTGGTYTQAGANWGLGRSFTTVRFMPHPRIELSVNHTYYRDLPFLDPSTITSAGIAAGLFDKFLTQGTMGGVRVEVKKQIWLSASLGLNNRSGESKNSLNQLYGITFGRVPWVKANLDARYSRFNSTFGAGSYEALSFTRNLTEGLQIQVLAGQQNFASTLTSADRSRFVNGMIESSLGRHYFIQAGGTISRGNEMSYEQWLFTFGYRFDNRQGQKAK